MALEHTRLGRRRIHRRNVNIQIYLFNCQNPIGYLYGRSEKLTGRSFTKQCIGNGILICPLTSRGQSLLAIPAVAAGDWKRSNDPLAHFDSLHSRSRALNDAAKLVSKNVAFLQLRDGSCKGQDITLRLTVKPTMIKMEIAPAYGSACHLENDIAIVNDSRLGHLN